MRLLLHGLVLAIAIAGAVVAEARIGESEAQLVARFGAVQTRRPEPLLEQGRVFMVGERVVLRKQAWRVTAVLIDERCAKITYARAGAWTEQHYRDLLALNAERWAWNEIPSGAPKWQRTWRRSDGLVAKWMYAGGLAIEGQTFVDARDRAREMARREPPATASR